MRAPFAVGGDEPLVLIEAERGRGDAAAPRHLADGQQFVHDPKVRRAGLDFKFT